MNTKSPRVSGLLVASAPSHMQLVMICTDADLTLQSSYSIRSDTMSASESAITRLVSQALRTPSQLLSSLPSVRPSLSQSTSSKSGAPSRSLSTGGVLGSMSPASAESGTQSPSASRSRQLPTRSPSVSTTPSA